MAGLLHAELEVTLSRALSGAYRAELRFSRPDSETEVPPVRGTLSLDPELLLEHQHDPRAYAGALTEALFADPGIGTFYAEVRATVESSGLPLRLRLRVDSTAQELHALRWELLRDPKTDVSLATSERILFSRFMASADWRRVRIGPKAGLRALIAVSAPTNLGTGFTEIDLDGEIRRARESLAGMDLTVVGDAEPLTLGRLVKALGKDPDVLYLICHGALSRSSGEPALYLQGDDGKAAVCRGQELAERLAELARPPRLAVLASCESAGTEGAGAFAAQAALAPRLAEAGLAAVIAMQGKISMGTVEKMMPIFFRELLADGQIDRALAAARGAVRERADSWMPALYMRLKRGRIWYEPGFSGDDADFAKWRSITASVGRGDFVPVLGGDVGEHVFGSTRELAGRLSEQLRLPLAGRDRADLPKVTQFMSVSESRNFARKATLRSLSQGVVRRYFPEIAGASDLPLPQLLDAVVERQDPGDPYRLLAELPAAVYVNACQDPLLIKSLKAAGREPRPLLCDWRPSRDNHPRAPAYDGEPNVLQPVVHHVFGVLGKADSLVLTEDDFFDYLIATAQYELVPTVVSGALTRGSLLFLGFQLDSWSFRVLFRLLMAVEGKHRLHEFAHVGVQVHPEESSMEDVRSARDYLERYFSGTDTPPISIYWGSVGDFLEDLRQRLADADVGRDPAGTVRDEDDWLS